MESLVITWRELLIVVILVLAVYAAELVLFLRSGGKRMKASLWRRGQEDEARPKWRELRALRDELDLVKGDLADLQGEIKALKEQMAASGQTPYTQAIQMAKEGRDINEVAAACGISRGEAELIVAVHRHDSQ
jgi:hypothetical protein